MGIDSENVGRRDRAQKLGVDTKSDDERPESGLEECTEYFQ